MAKNEKPTKFDLDSTLKQTEATLNNLRTNHKQLKQEVEQVESNIIFMEGRLSLLKELKASREMEEDVGDNEQSD